MALYTVTSGNVAAAADLNQIVNVLNGTDTTTQITVANRIRAQMANATAASGYVGGTTSGAPGAGTWLVGDYVIDRTGYVWICTVAGTPGTWVATAPNASVPLKIDQITTSGSQTSFTFSTIPSSFNNLRIAWRGASPGSADQIHVRFNGDSANHYECDSFFWGASSGSTYFTSANNMILGTMRAFHASGTMWIPGCRDPGPANAQAIDHGWDGTNSYTQVYGGAWNGTPPVSSITCFTLTNNFNNGCVFELWGEP